jgi:hypothetical protein
MRVNPSTGGGAKRPANTTNMINKKPNGRPRTTTQGTYSNSEKIKKNRVSMPGVGSPYRSRGK